jgi:phosphoenolpyruvate carboxykinase (GTP)
MEFARQRTNTPMNGRAYRARQSQEVAMSQILDQPASPNQRRPRRPHPGELANDAVRRFVHRVLRLCRPDRIYWCNGSDYELDQLTVEAVRSGIFEQPAVDGRAVTATYPEVEPLFKDCMKGRTMYVVPFITSPTASAPAEVGVQITDSLRTTLTLAETARVGDPVLHALGPGETSFWRGVHSAGDGIAGHRYVCNVAPDDTVWCFGTTNP